MRKLFLSLVAVLLCCSVASAYDVNSFDAIAGHKALVEIEDVPTGEVKMELTTPQGEIFEFTEYANTFGSAFFEIPDIYTKRSGEYEFKILAGGRMLSVDSFRVYADELSLERSTIKTMPLGVNDYLVSVYLSDAYGNPISGHIVKILPTNDFQISDEDGFASFRVGNINLEHLTIYDATEDVFLQTGQSLDIRHAIGNSAGAIDEFEFEDVPDTINVGEPISFKLVAYDSLNQVVLDYNNTVRFSVVSDNGQFVNLPNDYTFVPEDLGMHTFNLALSFQQPGDYDIEVRDINNAAIFGEFTFEVFGRSSAVVSNSTLQIDNPIPGTYSNGIQVISGQAPPGSSLKIFDNNLEIASIVAGISGVYSYTTGVLEEGSHEVYVAQVNEVGTIINVSETVRFSIDSFAPEVSRVVFEPGQQVAASSVVNLQLYVEERLASASFLVNGELHDLTDSGNGFYEGSFVSPVTLGDYGVTFVLVDQLGNESRLENEAILEVSSLVGSAKIGDVTSLTAFATDHRVTLNWVAPTFTEASIKHYRIFYGLSPNELTEAVDTFTNSPTWYIPNLKNGTKYYFAAVAVDENGNISEHFSNIIDATPGPSVVDVPQHELVLGTGGEDALKELETEVSNTGPEGFIWLVILSLIGGSFYVSLSRSKFEN